MKTTNESTGNRSRENLFALKANISGHMTREKTFIVNNDDDVKSNIVTLDDWLQSKNV